MPLIYQRLKKKVLLFFLMVLANSVSSKFQCAGLLHYFSSTLGHHKQLEEE